MTSTVCVCLSVCLSVCLCACVRVCVSLCVRMCNAITGARVPPLTNTSSSITFALPHKGEAEKDMRARRLRLRNMWKGDLQTEFDGSISLDVLARVLTVVSDIM